MAGGWNNFHDEGLDSLHSSGNIRMMKRRRIRWVVHVAFMQGNKNAYRIFVIILEEKRPLG